MLLEEPDDLWCRVDESCSEVCKRGLTHDDQQPNGMTSDGGELVGLVADPAIVRHRHPATAADVGKPNVIRTVGREVVPMALNTQSCFPQNLRKADAEVPVGEEDNAQAALS